LFCIWFFWGRIMHDERRHMWIHYTGRWNDNCYSSSIGGRVFIIHDCCTAIGAITNCQTILKKIKILDDETNVERRWNEIILVYVFERSGDVWQILYIKSLVACVYPSVTTGRTEKWREKDKTAVGWRAFDVLYLCVYWGPET
jgi:hypothetical protein